jgi:hypothetical protein
VAQPLTIGGMSSFAGKALLQGKRGKGFGPVLSALVASKYSRYLTCAVWQPLTLCHKLQPVSRVRRYGDIWQDVRGDVRKDSVRALRQSSLGTPGQAVNLAL